MSDELYPGAKRDGERQHIIKDAVFAAESVIMDGSDGSVEESDWLTSKVALELVQRVHGANDARLARYDGENRYRDEERSKASGNERGDGPSGESGQ